MNLIKYIKLWYKERKLIKSQEEFWNTELESYTLRELWNQLRIYYLEYYETLPYPSHKIQKDTFSLQDVAGHYTIEGHNPFEPEKVYHGQMAISLNEDRSFDAHWSIGFSQQIQEGVGFMYHDLLAITFKYYEEEYENLGLVIYQIDEGGLQGIWLEPGVVAPGKELAKKK